MSTVKHNGADWWLLLGFVFVQYPTRLSHKQAYMEIIIQNNVRGNAMKCFSGTDRHDICWTSFSSFDMPAWLCVPLSFSFFDLSLNFSTMGTFLWQLVTMEQILPVCLRAWFTNDVTCSKHRSTATKAQINESCTCLPAFIYCRRCCSVTPHVTQASEMRHLHHHQRKKNHLFGCIK